MDELEPTIISEGTSSEPSADWAPPVLETSPFGPPSIDTAPSADWAPPVLETSPFGPPSIDTAPRADWAPPVLETSPIEGSEIKELAFAAQAMLAAMRQRHHIKKLKESLIDKGVMVAEAQKLTLAKDELNKPQTVTNSEGEEVILPSTTIPRPITRRQLRKDRKLDKISARLQKDSLMSYSRAIDVANKARSNPQFKAGMPANIKTYGLLTPEEMARWRTIDTQGYGRGRRTNPGREGTIAPTKAAISIDKYEKRITDKTSKRHKRLLALANDGEEKPDTQRRGAHNTGGKLARIVNRRIDRHAKLAGGDKNYELREQERRLESSPFGPPSIDTAPRATWAPPALESSPFGPPSIDTAPSTPEASQKQPSKAVKAAKSAIKFTARTITNIDKAYSKKLYDYIDNSNIYTAERKATRLRRQAEALNWQIKSHDQERDSAGAESKKSPRQLAKTISRKSSRANWKLANARQEEVLAARIRDRRRDRQNRDTL